MADTDLTILYLHGFLSSPLSKKAQQTIAYCEQLGGMADRLVVPTLHNGPAETSRELLELVETLPIPQLGVIGSSLGGFYATWLSEEFDIPAVLINPAVRPFDLWEDHLGEHKNYYSDHIHVVTREHIDELRELDRSPISRPENFLVLLQKGDEVLDYRDAAEKFVGAQCVIHENGDHSYQEYAAELPAIIDFLLSRIGHSAR
ncbi:MAG: esterase [Pseudomonadales bacterium]|nr:esterase [Pseudomonadales bacterium]